MLFRSKREKERRLPAISNCLALQRDRMLIERSSLLLRRKEGRQAGVGDVAQQDASEAPAVDDKQKKGRRRRRPRRVLGISIANASLSHEKAR